MRKFGWPMLGLSMAVAMPCDAAAQESDTEEQAYEPDITIRSRWEDNPAHGSDGDRLLRRASAGRFGYVYLREVPIPPMLVPDMGERDVMVWLDVDLNSAGNVTACTGDRLEYYYPQERRFEDAPALPAELAEEACGLSRNHSGFRPALDQQGSPVSSTASARVEYSWRRPLTGPPPAPNPPDSWVPSVPNRYMFDYRDYHRWVSVNRPDGSQFLEEDRTRPRRAEVDLVISADAQGAITECTISTPSGIADYDNASCPALEAAGVELVQSVRDFTRILRNFPVRVRWNRTKMQVVMPGKPVGPMIIGDLTLDPALTAGIDISEVARGRAELTISSNGELSFCEISESTGHDYLDLLTCRHFAQGLRYSQPINAFGDAAEGRISASVDWNRQQIYVRY
ncbi:hypothetical protein [Alteraurantiacibacter aquimixticola]|uniref:Uncharacterized protein n=1 Tax=Alteraurantiacibacter aquimixticola TaxID=2489173 RepID=A0A4T3F3F4_9SPHN|nr:hypothetical protein [Alteraurantiacibacter aquimixticola]TIX51785.1 hypothetical protein E5222_04900 [Alteraurantiacibacter aquimixticola]